MKWDIFEQPNDLKGRSKVATYVEKKFRDWKPWKVSLRSQAWRIKAYETLIFSQNTPFQDIVENKYFLVFQEPVPSQMELQLHCPKIREKRKISANDWEDAMKARIGKLNVVLAQLREWKENGDYQLGDYFYSDLETAVELIDPRIMDSVNIERVNSVSIGAKHKLSIERTDNSFEAAFEGMVGLQQQFEMSFVAGIPSGQWGQISAKLEESFKAGVWGNASAKANLEKLGFSAEVQAAIAIGMELEVKGSAQWQKGDHALKLGGQAKAFVGAEANVQAKLSVSALKGLEASIKAGAFAGFKAEAKGSFGIVVAGRDIMSAEASVAVVFGAGAELNASIKVPILGPTKIEFKALLSLGLGVETGCTFEINISETVLASKEVLLRMKYYRYVLKGYSTDLMNADARNLFYLNKAIKRFEATIEELEESIKSRDKIPIEKRSLLVDDDDF